MCGIAGIIKFPSARPPPLDSAALGAMSAAIAHRGPDGAGEYLEPRGHAALLHRRLAILDLPGGGQPMANEDGSVQVVFNGEIYNHAELRRELQAAGHRFASDHSDTEVLVHGWEAWKTGLPSRLRGMFAFAIWDAREAGGTLFLARDRMGQKPLFYASLEDGIVFGSTIPAVLAWPEVPRRMPREALAAYLQLGYFAPPQTPLRDISQVMPGHWLRLRGEVLDGNRYWSPLPGGEVAPHDDPGSALRARLREAVESQLISDVPIACFLSGGIDSSIIALLMQNAARAAGGPAIHTVSVGFAEAGFDETEHAAAVAKHIGSRHTRLEVNAAQNVIETLQFLMRTALGQPFADSSILPTYHLSKAVRALAPVALAGDGGDELFAGYDRYRAMQHLARWGSVARLMPRTAPVGMLAKRERYRRLAAAARKSNPADRYTRLTEITPPDLLEALAGTQADYLPPDVASAAVSRAGFRAALLRDQLEYLPGDLLCKVDSAAMADALEVRAPFLDHSLVEFANSLPDDRLLRGGTSKFILRQAYAADLPPHILARPKKGFGVPIGSWFKSSLRDPLQDLLFSKGSFVTAHLHKPSLERLVQEHLAETRDHTHRLFALLMLELWGREFRPTLE
ncbi:MAG TPA: asparagine synthase (glutamine-hydrolyzing) [Phycisphaerae bacterium]|jgi:asparagine synthase (glutamine-hydrolysing)|nr:asparagine synthase (glutamine-hydrolyzing) [Phycisphaerae bacterium]